MSRTPASNPPDPHPGRLRTVHVVVSGTVQGVGFRWACIQVAEDLGLVGRVRNRSDGDVEVTAQGEPDDVSRLIAWLHRGPRWSQVMDVAVTDLRPGSVRARSFDVDY
ncbi:acylphosphatase [Actinomyces sp. oral taxon 448]|jgi:acylphosphatase|uniref:acylphosphatase n=1 Tax=Actinomyces sp. oral taxon 448 TaxID=712124 RepID=UPI00021886CA|nr:acylphosphatase [Actinomyces sp. oral taxon 448]EGQ74179.1 acylphosphatase [Actinomyces sp. oral taxon 448 str. F0400]